MFNNKPVCIIENGEYNNYITKHVIPDMLKIIEKSGLSFVDARRIPAELSSAIEEASSKMLRETVFKDSDQNNAQ